VRFLRRTSVWGYYDGNTLAAIERVTDHLNASAKGAPRHRHWTIRAGSVVLATGALERPLVFPGNDLPGVMLAGAAERYANDYGVLPGEETAIFPNTASAYRAAAARRKAGAAILASVGVRQEVMPAALALAAEAGLQASVGHAVTGTTGGKQLTGIKVQRLNTQTGLPTGDVYTIAVDALAVSGGWSPAIHLASQAGALPEWDPALNAFLPPKPTQNWRGAGAFTGSATTAEALAEGRNAG